MVSFKPRLPFYILGVVFIFEAILEFYTLKYGDYDEAMYAARVMQILETPWPVQYNIIRWPMRGWLIREELLFYISAVFAKVFGLSYAAIKIPPIMFHMSMIVLVFIFCYKFFSYEVAVLSSLLSTFGIQGYQHHINFDWAFNRFLMIVLTYLFFSKIIKDKRQSLIPFFAFGIIAGISLDVSRAILAFLFTSILFLIYKKREQILSGEFLVLGLGLTIGSIPMLRFVTEGNPLTFTPQGTPVSFFELSSWGLHLKTFPQKFMSMFNFFGNNNSLYAYVISFIFAAAMVLLYLFTIKEVWVYFRQSRGVRQKSLLMEILLFIDVYLPLYLFTFIYINDINTPTRYMLFIYPLIAVFFGISLMMVINKYKLKRAFNIIVALLLVLGTSSYLLRIKTPDAMVDELYQRGESNRIKSEELHKVIQFLKTKGIDHVFCDGGLRWPVIFLSRGALQASSTFFFTSPNYAPSLDKRFYETINMKNFCFVYYDYASDNDPIRDKVFKFLEKDLKGKYKVEKIDRFGVAYSG